MRRCDTCGKGCGEIYWGEWISDPPDCCDPCDQCYGCYTGPHGACCLGPFQRLLAAFHGYSYCPPPDCGPFCGGFCNRGGCGSTCGGGGCASCGGDPHGAVLGGGPYSGGPYGGGYSEDVLPPPNVNLAPGQRMPVRSAPRGVAPMRSAPVHVEPEHSILDENWNIPKSQPVPGKPIHKAQQPPRAQMTQRSPAVGSGVRQANYLR